MRARVILLGREGGGMSAKVESKNDVIEDFERRVHQHDARQLFANMRPTTISHHVLAHGHVAIAVRRAWVLVGKPASSLLPETFP